jgi:hypothetical protein
MLKSGSGPKSERGGLLSLDWLENLQETMDSNKQPPFYSGTAQHCTHHQPGAFEYRFASGLGRSVLGTWMCTPVFFHGGIIWDYAIYVSRKTTGLTHILHHSPTH